jgi:hypothetical protein
MNYYSRSALMLLYWSGEGWGGRMKAARERQGGFSESDSEAKDAP